MRRSAAVTACFGVAVMILFAATATCRGQCVGGNCPNPQFSFGGISGALPFQQQFRDPNGGGRFDPVGASFSAVCQINGASGSLIAKGDDWGVVWTCAHGPLPENTTAVFPATGERMQVIRIAFNKSTDNAAYKTIGRPRAGIVLLAKRMPRAGEEIGYGGFGRSQKWQAFKGKFIGSVSNRATNTGTMISGVRWAGSSRPGDSGGPAWIPGEGLFSLVTASGDGETLGPTVAQLCQLVDENRTLFPWNADTLREKSRNESEVAREQERTEQARIQQQQQPTPVSGPIVDPEARRAIDSLAARVSAVEQTVDTGRDLVEKLGLLDADVETVAKAAELLAGKVEVAEAKAAEAVEANQGLKEKLADAALKAEGAATAAEGLKAGIAGKAKEAVMGVLMKFGPWGLGGVGIALFVLFKIIKKDIRDFLENGDPLIIQKIAAKVPGSMDDRAADFIADRIQRRWGAPQQPIQQQPVQQAPLPQ